MLKNYFLGMLLFAFPLFSMESALQQGHLKNDVSFLSKLPTELVAQVFLLTNFLNNPDLLNPTPTPEDAEYVRFHHFLASNAVPFKIAAAADLENFKKIIEKMRLFLSVGKQYYESEPLHKYVIQELTTLFSNKEIDRFAEFCKKTTTGQTFIAHFKQLQKGPEIKKQLFSQEVQKYFQEHSLQEKDMSEAVVTLMFQERPFIAQLAQEIANWALNVPINNTITFDEVKQIYQSMCASSYERATSDESAKVVKDLASNQINELFVCSTLKTPQALVFLDQYLKADPNKEQKATDLLCIAAADNNIEIAHIALKNGARINGLQSPLNMQNTYGSLLYQNIEPLDSAQQTALIIASAFGHKEMIEFLLINKADVNFENRGGLTPLIAATLTGHTTIVQLLLEHGAHINHQLKGTHLHFSALMVAVKKGNIEMIKLLLSPKYKANIHLMYQQGDIYSILEIMQIDTNDINVYIERRNAIRELLENAEKERASKTE